MNDLIIDILQDLAILALCAGSIGNSIRIHRLSRRIKTCTCSETEHPLIRD